MKYLITTIVLAVFLQILIFGNIIIEAQQNSERIISLNLNPELSKNIEGLKSSNPEIKVKSF